MATLEVISEEPMNLSQLKAEIAAIKKRDKEPGFRLQKTEDYINNLELLDAKKAEELYKKIEKLQIPRIRDIHIHKIVDLLPTHVDDLKVIFQGYPITITNENYKKIVDTVNEFIK